MSKNQQDSILSAYYTYTKTRTKKDENAFYIALESYLSFLAYRYGKTLISTEDDKIDKYLNTTIVEPSDLLQIAYLRVLVKLPFFDASKGNLLSFIHKVVRDELSCATKKVIVRSRINNTLELQETLVGTELTEDLHAADSVTQDFIGYLKELDATDTLINSIVYNTTIDNEVIRKYYLWYKTL